MPTTFPRLLVLSIALTSLAACGGGNDSDPDAAIPESGNKTPQQVCEEHGGRWVDTFCAQSQAKLPQHFDYFDDELFNKLGADTSVFGARLFPTLRLYVVPEVGKALHCAYGEVAFNYYDQDENKQLVSTDCTFTMTKYEYVSKTHSIEFTLTGEAVWRDAGGSRTFRIWDGSAQSVRFGDSDILF